MYVIFNVFSSLFQCDTTMLNQHGTVRLCVGDGSAWGRFDWGRTGMKAYESCLGTFLSGYGF